MAFVYTAAGEAAARISAYDNKNHRWQTESKQYDLQHGRTESGYCMDEKWAAWPAARRAKGKRCVCNTDERKAAVAWTKSGRHGRCTEGER